MTAFASRPAVAYIPGMSLIPLPRPASPKGALADLRGFVTADHPYKWVIWLVSIALTATIIWGFVLDSRQGLMPTEPDIIYFQNWRADRSDVEVLQQLRKDVAAREVAIERNQTSFQKTADLFGIAYKEDAARNRAKRIAENKRIIVAIDTRIAAARAKDAKPARPAEPANPAQ